MLGKSSALQPVSEGLGRSPALQSYGVLIDGSERGCTLGVLWAGSMATSMHVGNSHGVLIEGRGRERLHTRGIDIVTALLANVSSSDVDTINNVGNHLTASGQ